MKIKALILAGGKGTRMKQNIPKALTVFLGIPFITRIISTLKEYGINDIGVVTGFMEEKIKKEVKEKVVYFHQENMLGTADAVKAARLFYKKEDEYILIIPVDVPLITTKHIRKIINKVIKDKIDVLIVTNKVPNPYGYGRIIYHNNGQISIIEEKELTKEYKKKDEINTGIYLIRSNVLLENIDKITNNNKKHEYYFTDILEYINPIYNTKTLVFINDYYLFGVNNMSELSFLEQRYEEEIVNKWLLKGVRIIDPKSVWIEDKVIIEDNVMIDKGVIIKGNSIIKKGSYLRPYTEINNKKVGNF